MEERRTSKQEHESIVQKRPQVEGVGEAIN